MKTQETAGFLDEIALQQSGLVREENGFTYRDLNKNGRLDIYEDPRQPIEARVEDLLGQMTLEEKAGMLFINGAMVNPDASLEKRDGGPGPGAGRAAADQITNHKMNHFNLWQIPGGVIVAQWQNNLQRFSEQTR